jgi:glycosyltransferase involved in cell wall biosynthesis
MGGPLTWNRNFIAAAGGTPGVELELIGWNEHARQGEQSAVIIGSRAYRVLGVGEGPLPRRYPHRLAFFARPKRWREVVHEAGNIDIFYCHTPESVLALVHAGATAPIALHLHGAANAIGRSRFVLGRLPLIMTVYERAVLFPALGAVVAVFATVSASEHRRLCEGRTIPRGIPCIRTTAMVPAHRKRPQVKAIARKPLRLICVGRLEEIKGVDLPIAALAALQGRGVECVLHVVGEGSDRGHLQAVAKKLGVADQVIFHGMCHALQVEQLVSEADIYVSGSYHEGFSNALLEAVAAGTPAVVTDVGSASELVIANHTGCLVRGRDPERFADALLAVAGQLSVMSEHCVAIASGFSSYAVTGQIIAELSAAVGRSAGVTPSEPHPSRICTEDPWSTAR